MRQTDLFASRQPHPLHELGEKLWALARQGIYLGTSSWKYESWKGLVYVETYKSKHAFDETCLYEYASIFPAVGGDFSYYNWPTSRQIAAIDEQTPEGFKIGLKATEFITLKRFPAISRWGEKAGQPNPDFLNVDLFWQNFLEPLTPLRPKLAPIILEFTAFPKGAFAHWSEFAEALENFLTHLPGGFEFGIEVRAKEFYAPGVWPEWWQTLKHWSTERNVAPILNSWTRTPPLDEQWRAFPPYSLPFIECRPITRPGRMPEEATKLFSPYAEIQERVEPARRAMVEMIGWATSNKRPCYIFVNNNLEGCAFQTITELAQEL